ncbi:MAG: hypothetical protein ACKOKB_05585, partial [Bacteroidota bacterium]
RTLMAFLQCKHQPEATTATIDLVLETIAKVVVQITETNAGVQARAQATQRLKIVDYFSL